MNTSVREARTADQQSRFLEAYATHGRITTSAEASSVSIGTVDTWLNKDYKGFQKRLKEAQRIFADSLEKLMLDRLENPQGNRGSDPLLMFYLKGVSPGKYREDVKVIDGGVAAQLLDTLRKLGSPAPVLEPGPVVEAVVRELDG